MSQVFQRWSLFDVCSKACSYPSRKDRRVCDLNELGFVHVVDDAFPSWVLSALQYQDSIACIKSGRFAKV
jgi:hypothetical protein